MSTTRERPLAASAPSSVRAVPSRSPSSRPSRFRSCPNCGGTDFRRSSMFEQPTLRNIAVTRPAAKPEDWLDGVRESITEPGKYLAMFADGRTRVIELSDGWSRIGRSRSADIRLDDPTVSRRHAVDRADARGRAARARRSLDERHPRERRAGRLEPARGRRRAADRPLHAERHRERGPDPVRRDR